MVPDARLEAIPFPLERLQEALGPNFRAGMRVSCEKCLEPCSGLEKLEGGLHAEQYIPKKTMVGDGTD
jgi:hypothetical protein